MKSESFEKELKTSEFELYAALVMSDYLETEQDVKEVSSPIHEQDSNNDIIWVPADKHPQIAPNEFATYIKTHGINTPARRATSLNRKKSVLSQSISNEEEDDDDNNLNRSLSEKKRIFLKKVLEDSEQLKDKTQVFDRNSTSHDDSKIIAPRTDKSLLRRSAFSARGRTKKTFNSDDRQAIQQRRSLSQRKSSPNTDDDDVKSVQSIQSNTSWDKSKGVSLFDKPVNLGELIDLGNVNVDSNDSQRGILSRVHDAESQLRSQLDTEESEQQQQQQQQPDEPVKKLGIIHTQVEPVEIKPTISNKPDKRSSWLGGLFTAKSNNSNVDVSPLSGLSSIFNRSMSMKTNNLIKIKSNNTTTTTTTTTTINNNHNTNTNTNDNHNQSSRLETLAPSKQTFFNSNRLPLHVERAIYRLSHLKLTDNRRPLHQQVLISNLMFWYLSIQQNDMRVEPTTLIQATEIQPKKSAGNKMSRLLFNSVKKRKNEAPSRPPLRQTNIQFSLPQIPTHRHQVDDDEEEDDVPLSYYRN